MKLDISILSTLETPKLTRSDAEAPSVCSQPSQQSEPSHRAFVTMEKGYAAVKPRYSRQPISLDEIKRRSITLLEFIVLSIVVKFEMLDIFQTCLL
eukprot:UN25660